MSEYDVVWHEKDWDIMSSDAIKSAINSDDMKVIPLDPNCETVSEVYLNSSGESRIVAEYRIVGSWQLKLVNLRLERVPNLRG